jgi:glutamate/tyrosine decarboxylase-like PLP-dependent enzyme
MLWAHSFSEVVDTQSDTSSGVPMENGAEAAPPQVDPTEKKAVTVACDAGAAKPSASAHARKMYRALVMSLRTLSSGGRRASSTRGTGGFTGNFHGLFCGPVGDL